MLIGQSIIPNKIIIKTDFDKTRSSIIKSVVSGKYDTLVNAVWASQILKVKVLNKVEYEIQEECKSISSKKKPSVLSHVSPASIISLKDMDVVNELKERAPVTHRCMQAIACSKKRSIKKDGVDYKLVNSLSMAASVLLRCRNPCLSAAAYRLSVLLCLSNQCKI